jgi:hypothetical protein
MSEQTMLSFLCSECLQTTPFQWDIELGDNIVDVTCFCGERWHISFRVLQAEPLMVGDWLVKRTVGIIRDNTFFAKEQLQ